MHALLDRHGLFLCYDRDTSQLCRAKPGDVRRGKILVYLTEGSPAMLAFEVSGTVEPIALPPGGSPLSVIRADIDSSDADRTSRAGSITLGAICERDDVDPGSNAPSETFQFIDRAVADDLVSFCQDRWIVAATRRLLDFRTTPVICGAIEADGFRIAIRDCFPFIDAKRHGHVAVDVALVREGWKVDRVRRYRPAVVIVQFGDRPTSLQMIEVLSTSLIEIGEFDGDLLVIGDQPASTLRSHIHPAFHDSMMTSHRIAQDGFDFCMARWSMGESGDLDGYQPILYCDTDTICDGVIDTMLIELACADHVSAQVEYFNPASEAESCGNFLFAQDPIALDGLHGFCSGLVGLPNLYKLGAALRLIQVSAAAYVKQYGPRSLLWNDQPVVNYVLRKLCVFEEGPVGRATTIPERAEEIVLADRRGFIHFWRAGTSENRAREMQLYLQRLLKAKESGNLPAVSHGKAKGK